jgi:type IV fimbrial biogenesis protein FimT
MNSYNRGFTLLDLLISLSILSITFGFGLPNLKESLDKAQMKSTNTYLHRSAVSARHFALTEEEDITLCGVNNNDVCIRKNFKNISVFKDINRNAIIDPDEEVLSMLELKYPGELTLRASLSRPYFRFEKDGSSEVAGSFIYCDSAYAHHSSRLTISMSGRAYRGTDRNGDGIVEGTNRRAIRC